MEAEESIASAAEWRIIAYIELSLRRYASHWRRKQRRQAWYEVVLLNQTVGHQPDDGQELAQLLPGAQAAEEEYLSAAPLEELLTERRIYQALLQLPPHQREVLSALVLQGIKQETLARRLGVSQQAVQKTKQRALQRLRTSIDGHPLDACRNGRLL